MIRTIIYEKKARIIKFLVENQVNSELYGKLIEDTINNSYMIESDNENNEKSQMNNYELSFSYVINSRDIKQKYFKCSENDISKKIIIDEVIISQTNSQNQSVIDKKRYDTIEGNNEKPKVTYENIVQKISEKKNKYKNELDNFIESKGNEFSSEIEPEK